jgi:V/A-type H+-transporting ATPase subunit E
VQRAESPVEVHLPERAAGLEELRQDPHELQDGQLTSLVLGLTREMLKEGVTIAVSEEVPSGVRVRIVEDAVELDMTQEAVAALLLRHLQPRFRAILEGVVR